MDTEFELISYEADYVKNPGDVIAEHCREAGFKVKRTVIPGSSFWNDWTKYPWSTTEWNMRPLGVQILALAYRSGEAWNEWPTQIRTSTLNSALPSLWPTPASARS